MFTKYNGITPPQNYSGNRFKPFPNDTEMKTHKGTEPTLAPIGIKTSVSPTFQETMYKSPTDETENDTNEISSDISYSEGKDNSLEKTEIIDTPPDESTENTDMPVEDLFSFGAIGKFLKGLKNDDILLLTLILILSEENSPDGSDAILILALLLMLR